MKVAARLEELRGSLPGCSLVVFGDLFSQITLCVSSQDKHPQEQLDALCVTAGNLLAGPAAQSASVALGMPNGGALDQAIVLNPNGIQVFLRSSVDAGDVLCCVCSLNADVNKVSTQARTTLKLIAENQ